METRTNPNRKTYIVSFGHSDKYILHDDKKGKESLLTNIESELNNYLKEKFPDTGFAYFTTPRVDEISSLTESRYKDYPELDAAAIESIKEVLSQEVTNMEFQKGFNDNAPWTNVDPSAADLPHVL